MDYSSARPTTQVTSNYAVVLDTCSVEFKFKVVSGHGQRRPSKCQAAVCCVNQQPAVVMQPFWGLVLTVFVVFHF